MVVQVKANNVESASITAHHKPTPTTPSPRFVPKMVGVRTTIGPTLVEPLEGQAVKPLNSEIAQAQTHIRAETHKSLRFFEYKLIERTALNAHVLKFSFAPLKPGSAPDHSMSHSGPLPEHWGTSFELARISSEHVAARNRDDKAQTGLILPAHASQGFPAVHVFRTSTDSKRVDLVLKASEDTTSIAAYVHDMKLDEPVYLAGPVPGGLPTNLCIGDLAFFSSGTGILAYLDLIDFLTQDPTRKLALPVSRVALFASFDTEEDLILEDWLQARKERCKDADSYLNFEVYYLLKKPGPNWKGATGQWTVDQYAKWLPPTLNQIFVCGSLKYKASIYESLSKTGRASLVFTLPGDFT